MSDFTTAANSMLPDVRAHLRFPNPSTPSSEDAVLMRFLMAAMKVAEYHCGSIFPQTYAERYNGGDYLVFTRHIPILRVANVEEGWGWINYELDYAEVNAPPVTTGLFSYSIDNPETGQISRRTAASVQIPFRAGTDNIQIVYTAGESEVPADVNLGVLEAVAHWYQSSQLRSVAASPAFTQFDASSGMSYSREPDSQPIDFALPFRIIQMFRSHSRMPIIA